jgi:hypothetical protein
MSPDTVIAAVSVIAIVGIIAGSSHSLLKMWLHRPGHLSIPEADVRAMRDGLGQLQQAVDAIAIEVERLSEGQRFTTKLFADGGREIAPIPAKHVTE